MDSDEMTIFDQELMPKFTREQLTYCLQCFNGDKTKALEMLSNEEIKEISPDEGEVFQGFEYDDRSQVGNYQNEAQIFECNFGDGGNGLKQGKEKRHKISPIVPTDPLQINIGQLKVQHECHSKIKSLHFNYGTAFVFGQIGNYWLLMTAAHNFYYSRTNDKTCQFEEYYSPKTKTFAKFYYQKDGNDKSKYVNMVQHIEIHPGYLA